MTKLGEARRWIVEESVGKAYQVPYLSVWVVCLLLACQFQVELSLLVLLN